MWCLGRLSLRLPNSAFFLAFATAAESRHAAQMDMPPLAAAALAAALAPACPSEQRACSQRRRGRQGRRQSWVSESDNRPKHHKRRLPPPRRAHVYGVRVYREPGGIGEARAMCARGRGRLPYMRYRTLPSLGSLPYNSIHTFLVSYSSRVW